MNNPHDGYSNFHPADVPTVTGELMRMRGFIHGLSDRAGSRPQLATVAGNLAQAARLVGETAIALQTWRVSEEIAAKGVSQGNLTL